MIRVFAYYVMLQKHFLITEFHENNEKTIKTRVGN